MLFLKNFDAQGEFLEIVPGEGSSADRNRLSDASCPVVSWDIKLAECISGTPQDMHSPFTT